MIDLFDYRKDYTQVLTVRNCELKGDKKHDFNMNMHENFIMSLKEEQMVANKKIEHFKNLLRNYIIILHQGQKLTKAYNLAVKITSHKLELYDVLKDKVVEFIEKNKCHIHNENS